jgi:hypothetical protein
MNYCVTRRELLAIVYFLKYFRHYLLGRPFVRTDHAALQWLRRTSEVTGQQVRWPNVIEEYEFTVMHRPGARHGNADAMSRRPCLRAECCENGEAPIEVKAVSSQMARCSNWCSEHCDMAQEQDRDAEISIVKRMLESTPNASSADAVANQSAIVKSLCRQYHRLMLVDGVLMRSFEPLAAEDIVRQVVIPRRLRRQFIIGVHESLGHLGVTRTKAALQERAYWPGWNEDFVDTLRRCVPCARYKRGTAPKQTYLQPFSAGEPFETISIDITGPHPRSRNGFNFILTVQYQFTKWAEAIPLRNHTAPLVADALFKNIFMRFGMPTRLLSDQGAEFESSLFQQLCRIAGINKIRTTPYRPSTNGMIERFHPTLNSMLAKVIREDQRDWDERLPAVMMAYRASVHESTGYSPNRLVMGRELRLPIDLVYPKPPVPSEISLEQYVQNFQANVETAFDTVRRNLRAASRLRKDYYDSKVKADASFKQGDTVWYFYPRRVRGKSPKWQKWYTGPYEIVKEIDSHNFVIRRGANAKPIVVHKDKLKIYYPQLQVEGQNGVKVADGNVLEGNSAMPVDQPPREPSNVEEMDDRPRRSNKRPPRYLKQYVCRVFAGSTMATKHVQVPSGQPYCFICNTSFPSAYSLNRHNISHREKHEELKTRMDGLRNTSKVIPNTLFDAVPELHPSVPVLRVNSIFAPTIATEVCGQPTLPVNQERLATLVPAVLDNLKCRTVAEAAEYLVGRSVGPTDAQLIARTAFTAAKHLAGLHAPYMHLFSAPQNYARSDLLHDIGDKFTRFLIGIPEDDVSVQREVSIQVGDVSITVNPAETAEPAVPDVPEAPPEFVMTEFDPVEVEDIDDRPLDERLEEARALFCFNESFNEDHSRLQATMGLSAVGKTPQREGQSQLVDV